MSSYLYYPGCSLSGSARAYAESLTAILAPLGVELHEIDDWNCCGATEYLTISPLGGYALIGRNLALAERQRNGSSTLVAPCSACYANLA
ncbi:MAG: heterodisulfide reductase-related iron-sulfur binding cluster, partial [Candidatus Limnocylindrales bacterium]